MYICDCCKEEHIYDEMVFLNGNNIVEDEEHGGSGDIDEYLCEICHEVIIEIKQIGEKYGVQDEDFIKIIKYLN